MFPRSHRLACLSALVLVWPALGADRAQFRGPQGGASDETGQPAAWNDQSRSRWKTPLSGCGGSSRIVQPASDRIYASPLAADGKLYDVSRERGTYVLALRPEFQLLAHQVIADDTSVFNASPVPSRGELLLRSDRFLYCLGGQN